MDKENKPIKYRFGPPVITYFDKNVHSKNFDIAKQVIKENLKDGGCGIFNSRCLKDEMHNIYKADGLTIDICYEYNYFEVLGLDYHEFKALERLYYSHEL